MGLSRIVSPPVIDLSIPPRFDNSVGEQVWQIGWKVLKMKQWAIAALLY